MKKDILTVLILVAVLLVSVTPVAAQNATEEPMTDQENQPHQIPGFPPYAPPPTMLEVVEDKGATVVVRHMMGETEIPKNPQRVYAEVDTVAMALLLDLNLVSATDYGPYAALPNYDEIFEGVEVVGWADASMEYILSVNPDLILVHGSVRWAESGDPQATYEQLSAIAPTIVFNENTYSNWQQGAIDLAEALDLEDEVETKLDQFEADVEEACIPLQEAIGNEGVVRLSIRGGTPVIHTVGFFDSTGENFGFAGDTIWLYVYCELLPPTDLTNVIPVSSDDGSEALSAELIPELTADHMFVVSSEEGAEEVLDNPLWQAVPAVQNGNVYLLPNISSFSADLALNAIRQAAEAIEAASD